MITVGMKGVEVLGISVALILSIVYPHMCVSVWVCERLIFLFPLKLKYLIL